MDEQDPQQRDPQRWTKPDGASFLLEHHPLGEWVHWKDYVPIVDGLRAELDTLRAGVSSWKAEEEAWKVREAELLAQVATIRDVKEQCARQRDTLADLLARIWDSVPAESSGPSVERHAAVLNEIPTALLRKAGRL